VLTRVSLAQNPTNPIKNLQFLSGTVVNVPARFAYPIILDVNGVVVLVVGAGPVAARKVVGLAEAGATVRVVAPVVSPEMTTAVDAGKVDSLACRPFQPSDLDGVRLVVTATGTDADHEVATAAKAAGIWVNAADRPGDCSFILPAVARNGPVSIAVSTDGTSPALAQRLRDEAGALLTADVAALAVRLAAQRDSVKQQGGSTEQRDWSAEIDAVLGPPTSPTIR
jgi:precorrin-2 dehydrogenase / sirohydrochlorin ferrochelatase